MAFSEATKRSINLFKTKKYLIENIQFNNFDLYYSLITSVFFGLFFNFLVYLMVMPVIGIVFSVNMLIFIPLLFINLYLICIGTGVILAMMSLYWKDIANVWDMVLLLGFWTSGIFFKSGDILDGIYDIYSFFNPLIGLIENFRKVSFYNQSPDTFFLMHNFAYGILLFLLARFVYKRYSFIVLEKI